MFGRLLSFAALATLLSPDAPDAGQGGAAVDPPAPTEAPAAAVTEETFEDGPPLVVEVPEGKETDLSAPTAAAAPAAPATVTETPAGETPPAPAEPATPAPAAAPGTPDKAVQRLSEDMATMGRTLAELRDSIAAIAQQKPATPAAAASQQAALDNAQQQADELEKLLDPAYEVDVEQTPRELAKAVAGRLKRFDETLKGLQTSIQQRDQTAAQQEQTRRDQENRLAFEATQREIQAVNPAADLTAEWRACLQAAEGYRRFGDEALRTRASELFDARVKELKTAAAPPPAPPTPAPTPKPTPPTGKGAPRPAGPPITPGGAQVKVPTTGGTPHTPDHRLPTDDEIDARHSLVR